jgi:dipeptidyl aminopeptidase/acylaminoacyl peptidase
MLIGANARAEDAQNLALAFGARAFVENASLSPAGDRLVFVTPQAGPANSAMVEDLATGAMKPVIFADGNPLKISNCGWAADDRIVCELFGVGRYGYSDAEKHNLAYERIVAMNIDGSKQIDVGKANRKLFYGAQAYDGQIVDWLSGKDGHILMMRYESDGSLGLQNVDTRSGDGVTVKPLVHDASYITDGAGVVRMTSDQDYNINAQFTGLVTYRYRRTGNSAWQIFSKVGVDGTGLRPQIVDGAKNVAYCLQMLNGRDALYAVALDGSMDTRLIYANPEVDVDGVETIGRHNRVIGYRYVTDRTHIVYFDPEYEALAARLAKTIPQLPILSFESASADERRLLIFAGSDADPGHYYLYDRETHHLAEALPARPQLDGIALAEQSNITFQAKDGTEIPAYLTIPKGASGRGLPAIVMPHGGPSSRDVWGFDWLSQYFAAAGFAVLQPEFRGSSGYGEAFLSDSGFKSWRTAIGDVTDAGHWLIDHGIADPAKLVIFGWSYGGYAALQANYLDPKLFKAVVAVAPVTDISDMSYRRSSSTTSKVTSKFVGDYRNAVEGSPYFHARNFQAPVLMFHGDRDLNVDIDQSRKMDQALRHAGKQSRLVVYPGLDHQLDDSTVRADMLKKARDFLRDATISASPVDKPH